MELFIYLLIVAFGIMFFVVVVESAVRRGIDSSETANIIRQYIKNQQENKENHNDE